MKYIKQNKELKIILIKQLEKSFIKLYEYSNLLSNDVNQEQDDRYVSYITIVSDIRYKFTSAKSNIQIIFYYLNSFFRLDYTHIKNKNLDNFILPILKENSIEFRDKLDHLSCDIKLENIEKIIEKLSTKNFRIYKDSDKYNL